MRQNLVKIVSSNPEFFKQLLDNPRNRVRKDKDDRIDENKDEGERSDEDSYGEVRFGTGTAYLLRDSYIVKELAEQA